MQVMDHTHAQAGIIPRSIHRVFDYLKEKFSDDTSAFSVRISFLEVYNEQLIDLLSVASDDIPDDASGSSKSRRLTYDVKRSMQREKASSTKLRLVAEEGSSAVKVQGQEEVLVHDEAEVFAHVNKALQKRQVAATKCNDFSSRSHAIFTMTITLKEMTASGEEEMRVGKLHLVDLAGSENIGRSGATDGRAREAGNINQSLLVLGRVISALVEKRRHIPYRESKLTRLLQDSLGGSTKTCLIATISPSSGSVEETLSTLDYAARAKCIENKPEANKKMTRNALLRTQNHEIESLQRMLTAARSKEGVHLPQDMYDEMVAHKRSLENQLEELQDLKLVHEEEVGALKQALQDISDQLEESRAAHEATQAELQETQGTLQVTEADLEQKKVQVTEQRVVIGAHETAADALYGQATALSGTLSETVTDVAGLHAKVHRQQSAHDSNAQAAKAFSKSAQQQLAEATDGMHSSFAVQQEKLVQLSSSLQDSATQHKSSLANSAAAVLALAANMGTALANVSARVKQLAGDVSKQAATTNSGVAECAASVQSGLQDMNAQLNADVAALLQLTSQQMQASQAWHTRSSGYTQQLQAALQVLREQQGTALEGATALVHEAGVAAEQAFASQAVHAAAMGSSTKDSLDNVRQQVLAAVTAALDSAVADGKQSVEAHVENMTGSGAQAAAAVGTSIKAATASVQSAQEAADAWVATQQTAVKTECAAASASLATVQQLHASVAEQGQAALDGATTSNADATKQVRQLQVCATTGMTAVQQHGTAGQDDITGMAGEASVAAHEAAAATQDSVQQAASSMVSSIATGTSTINKVSTAVQRDLKAMAASVVAVGQHADELARTGIAAAPVTGATPAKKIYTAPAKLAMVSPEPKILSRLREHVAAGADVQTFQPLTSLDASVVTLQPGAATAPAPVAVQAPPAAEVSAPVAPEQPPAAAAQEQDEEEKPSTPRGGEGAFDLSATTPGSATSAKTSSTRRSSGSSSTRHSGADENAAPATASSAASKSSSRTGSRNRTRRTKPTSQLPGMRSTTSRRRVRGALGETGN